MGVGAGVGDGVADACAVGTGVGMRTGVGQLEMSATVSPPGHFTEAAWEMQPQMSTAAISAKRAGRIESLTAAAIIICPESGIWMRAGVFRTHCPIVLIENFS